MPQRGYVKSPDLSKTFVAYTYHLSRTCSLCHQTIPSGELFTLTDARILCLFCNPYDRRTFKKQTSELPETLPFLPAPPSLRTLTETGETNPNLNPNVTAKPQGKKGKHANPTDKNFNGRGNFDHHSTKSKNPSPRNRTRFYEFDYMVSLKQKEHLKLALQANLDIVNWIIQNWVPNKEKLPVLSLEEKNIDVPELPESQRGQHLRKYPLEEWEKDKPWKPQKNQHEIKESIEKI